MFLSENGADPAVPRGLYHRKCYQCYTHKSKLERVAAELSEGSSSDDEPGPDSQLEVSGSNFDARSTA